MLEQAHRILDAADRRRTTLSDRASDAHQRERAHARAYYDDALRSLERRRPRPCPAAGGPRGGGREG